jgi:lauroyl/myristoyl acyltransferase
MHVSHAAPRTGALQLCYRSRVGLHRVTQVDARQRGFVPSRRDLLLLGYLPPMALIAWLTPEAAWMPICARMARFSGRAGTRRGDNIKRIADLLSDGDGREAPTHIAAGIGTHHHHARLQWLRCYRSSAWRPHIVLAGRAHLEAALAGGKGVVLWIAPFVYSNIITKMTLADAGYRVTHLSGARHGLSSSPFAQRAVNPMWTKIEDRFLAERVVMMSAEASSALRQLVGRLRNNRVVSITMGSHGARRYRAPFFNGSITLANGAPSLARRMGAPLLPAFTVRTGEGALITTVEAPCPLPPSTPPADAEQMVVSHSARLLESYVRRWPEQFDGWLMAETEMTDGAGQSRIAADGADVKSAVSRV